MSDTVGTYLVICRRAYVPLVSDDDEVNPDNIGALKLGMMALQFEDRNDPDRAALFWGPNMPEKTGKMAGAFDLLNTEREETEVAEVSTISFGWDYGAGNIPQIR
jgi:hypothetical protein